MVTAEVDRAAPATSPMPPVVSVVVPLYELIPESVKVPVPILSRSARPRNRACVILCADAVQHQRGVIDNIARQRAVDDAVAELQGAGRDGRDAGKGVGIGKGDEAGGHEINRTAAADRPAEGLRSGVVEGQHAANTDAARNRAVDGAVAELQRAGCDRRAAAVGVGVVKDHQAAIVHGYRGRPPADGPAGEAVNEGIVVEDDAGRLNSARGDQDGVGVPGRRIVERDVRAVRVRTHCTRGDPVLGSAAEIPDVVGRPRPGVG